MSLGSKLRTLRLKDKKTLQEQSEVLGVSMNTVYRWEHNLAVPRKAMLNKIAGHYAISMDWLLSDNASASLVSDLEQQLLSMFRKLREVNKYKVLGYVECMYAEDCENNYFSKDNDNCISCQ